MQRCFVNSNQAIRLYTLLGVLHGSAQALQLRPNFNDMPLKDAFSLALSWQIGTKITLIYYKHNIVRWKALWLHLDLVEPTKLASRSVSARSQLHSVFFRYFGLDCNMTNRTEGGI
jgi:hypothetical protein